MIEAPCCICAPACDPDGICLNCTWCLHGCPALHEDECCQVTPWNW